MAMKYDKNALKNKFEKVIVKKYIDKHIAAFQKTGEDFVNDARTDTRWKYRSGNLSSSIGYVIMLEGIVVTNGIQGDTSEGEVEAEKLVRKVASGKGLELIGVAGMEYAIILEAKGYNVITVQGKWACINLADRVKKIKGLV